jgi:hypothetical protein
MTQLFIRSVIAIGIVALLVGSASAQDGMASGAADFEAICVAPEETALEERLRGIDAAVRVRVADAGVVRGIDITSGIEQANPDMTFCSRIVLPVTEYQTEVLEVIKGEGFSVVGTPLRIGIIGGRTTWQGHEIVAEACRLSLTPGAIYLVFLNQSDEFGTMMIAGLDVYRVDGPVVGGNPLAATTAHGKRFAGLPSNDVLSAVRSAAERMR